MARKKVDLTYIADESKRRATFKKRRSSLIKKMEEITILCGVVACAIIYAPGTIAPQVWPSPQGVTETLFKFRSLPQQEQIKRMLSHQDLLTQMIRKAQKQLAKRRRDNRKKEITQLMFQCLAAGKVPDNCNLFDLNDLSVAIDQMLKDISKIKEQQESVQNGAAAIIGDRSHVSGMQMNPGPVENMVNGGGDHMVPPFYGDTNQQNGYWPTQINP